MQIYLQFKPHLRPAQTHFSFVSLQAYASTGDKIKDTLLVVSRKRLLQLSCLHEKKDAFQKKLKGSTLSETPAQSLLLAYCAEFSCLQRGGFHDSLWKLKIKGCCPYTHCLPTNLESDLFWDFCAAGSALLLISVVPSFHLSRCKGRLPTYRPGCVRH